MWDNIKDGFTYGIEFTVVVMIFFAGIAIVVFVIGCVIVSLPDDFKKEWRDDRVQYAVEHPEEYDCRKKPQPMPIVVPMIIPMRS